MFILGAFLDVQALVDDPTAGWAKADRGVRSRVVVVFASLSWFHILAAPWRSCACDLRQLALQICFIEWQQEEVSLSQDLDRSPLGELVSAARDQKGGSAPMG